MSEMIDLSQVTEENNPQVEVKEETTKENKKSGKPLLIIIVAIVAVMVVATAFYLNYQKTNFVKTENASIQSNMITVSSKMAGSVLDVKVKQGDYVKKGDVIMEIEPLTPDTSQIDNSFVRATTDGTVLKTLNNVGQSITAGQTVCYIADEQNVYVIANIDEKDINNIHIGQNVDVIIDQYEGEKFSGRIVEVGSATLSAFSIVPSSSSGSFVKSTQLAPVKIKFEQNIDDVLIGANATVNIHIK